MYCRVSRFRKLRNGSLWFADTFESPQGEFVAAQLFDKLRHSLSWRWTIQVHTSHSDRFPENDSSMLISKRGTRWFRDKRGSHD